MDPDPLAGVPRGSWIAVAEGVLMEQLGVSAADALAVLRAAAGSGQTLESAAQNVVLSAQLPGPVPRSKLN